MPPASTDRAVACVTITDPGWLCAVQDLGRAGSERHGVASGGATDHYSATLANILVGNERGTPLLEVTARRFAFHTSAPLLMAVTGATADVVVDGCSAPMWQPVCVPANAKVVIAEPRDGIRGYVALHGVWDVPRFLGSVAPDDQLGFGTRLTAGGRLRLTTSYRGFTHPHFGLPLFRPDLPLPKLSGEVWTIDVTDGPKTDAVPGTRELLSSSTYTVGDRSNHVGLRLDGPVRLPSDTAEIVSHGVPVGAVEIPPSEELIVLLRSRVVTAGYPIIAIATRASLDLLGQAGPGRRLRFRWRSIDEAVTDQRARARALDSAAERLRTAYAAAGLRVAC